MFAICHFYHHLTHLQFPFALSALPSVLSTEWDTPSFLPYRTAFGAPHNLTPTSLESHIRALTSQDAKVPALKSLQGYLWRRGYETGKLSCPLFPDVPPCLHAWHSSAISLIIYSSGSVDAQKLLFQYTNAAPPDLRPLLSGYFDTVNAGPKMFSSSYASIAARYPDIPIRQWLFLSDNVKEVDASREAGMRAVVVVRPGNAELTAEERQRNRVIESFEELPLRLANS